MKDINCEVEKDLEDAIHSPCEPISSKRSKYSIMMEDQEAYEFFKNSTVPAFKLNTSLSSDKTANFATPTTVGSDQKQKKKRNTQEE